MLSCKSASQVTLVCCKLWFVNVILICCVDIRTEGKEEEIKVVVQKLNRRGNFPTQTGVRFRVLEKRAEGSSACNATRSRNLIEESMVYWDV